MAGLFLVAGAATARKPAPPSYRVHLVAAPAPTEDERKAPEAVERPAEEKPAPAPKAKSPKSTVAAAAPPPVADNTKREAAPRTTPKTQPLPGERPSTGSDPLTVSTEGIEFPFPEYTNNIISQIAMRWQRPLQSTPLEAEIGFLIHRDGSTSDMQFIKRSGNFAFDLEAQGAVEEAGRRRAFGPLPDGWGSDVLFVRFYFSDSRTVATAVRGVGSVAILLSVSPTVRPSLAAQDTSAVDRGVRIGIIYRPGVRPGLVVLPGAGSALDSVRTIIARDLDLSDRFELITLPGGDSIRVSAAAPLAGAGRPPAGGRGGAAAGLNYQLYQALGADLKCQFRFHRFARQSFLPHCHDQP